MNDYSRPIAPRKKSDRDAQLQQARQALLRKDYRTAYQIYDELLKQFPGDGAVLLDYGRAKFREFADLEQAAQLLLKAVEADPDSIDALLWLAEISAMGYGPGYAKAGSLYRRALKLDEQCVDAYIGLGMLYGAPSSSVTLQEAIAAYRKATQLAPQRSDAYRNLGFALLKEGDKIGAQQAFLVAMQLLQARGDEQTAQAIAADLEKLQRQEPLQGSVYRNESSRFLWPLKN
jgi:tetratricopeptide (TPR) repeat protein